MCPRTLRDIVLVLSVSTCVKVTRIGSLIGPLVSFGSSLLPLALEVFPHMQRDALELAAGQHMFGPVHVESLVAREVSLRQWIKTCP